jgi:serine/threonine protein kinase
MAFRRLLRGQIDQERLESVADEVRRRYDGADADGGAAGEGGEQRIVYLDANNWLSAPFVVDDRYFVKAISRQHTAVHALLTAGRNLGAFSSGSEGFFQRFETPVEMARHEYDATEKMVDIGVRVPEPIEAFEHDGLGVLVMEYLPEFETLDAVDSATVREQAPALFASLQSMHAAGFAHGDLRSENVLVSGGDLYFIDATNVDDAALADARAYDIACGLAVLEPLIGARDAVAAAASAYGPDDLIAAEDFLDFVNVRPDHQFDSVAVKGELGKAART